MPRKTAETAAVESDESSLIDLSSEVAINARSTKSGVVTLTFRQGSAMIKVRGTEDEARVFMGRVAVAMLTGIHGGAETSQE